MSQQGAVLQSYNNELIKCETLYACNRFSYELFTFLGIEDLSSKRDELQQQILIEEEEKQKIQNDIRILTERLAQVNEGLAHKISTRNDYDRTIAECETAYKKVTCDDSWHHKLL